MRSPVRSVVSAALLALAVLVAGCRPERPASTRLLADDRALEAATVDNVTMPARRLQVDASYALALGRVPAGRLALSAALEDGHGDVTLQVDGASEVCTVTPAHHWQPCRFTVGRTQDLQLHVRTAEPGNARVLVSQPMLRSGPASNALVLVVLIDTVRFDRLTTYEPTMPLGTAIDRLAHDGLVFDRVHSSSSWTRPAIATLFTGLEASTHKVFGRDDVLDPTLPHLATAMQRSGYRTVAVSTNPNVLPRWGFATGFDAFHDLGADAWPAVKVDASAAFAAVRSVLDETDVLPAFVYAHLMDAHAPYRPEDADLRAITADARMLASFPGSESSDPVVAEYARYLAEIRGMDRELGRFLDDLRARGLYDGAAILVLADHGEEFLDHGGTRHGRTLYEEVLRIPVVLKLPANALAGTRVATRMGLADVPPTLLGALGLAGLGTVDGRNVWNATSRTFDDAMPAQQRAVLKIDTYDQAAIIDTDRKLILDYLGDKGGLFDLAADPRERRSLLPERAAEADALRVALDAQIARHDAGWHVRVCGGTLATHVRLHIRVAGRLTAAGLEPDDHVAPGAPEDGIATYDADLAVTPRASERVIGNRLWKGMRPDEDDLVASDPAADRIVIRTADGAPFRWANGASTATSDGVELTATAGDAAATVRPSDPVDCRPADWTDDANAPVDPYVRVWWVPPADRRPAEVDPVLQERLRALGYQR